MLGNLLGGFIIVLVGANLIGPVADSIQLARYSYGSNATNITGASGTILNLTLVFFALGIMSSGVALAVNGLRQSGMI
jgi:hypothetical protein